MIESRRVDVTMSWTRVLNDECANINPNHVYASRIHASSYQNDISLVALAVNYIETRKRMKFTRGSN